jgi:hypothetical protein
MRQVILLKEFCVTFLYNATRFEQAHLLSMMDGLNGVWFTSEHEEISLVSDRVPR